MSDSGEQNYGERVSVGVRGRPRSHPASSRPLGPLRLGVRSPTSGGSRGAEGPGGWRLWPEGGRRWDVCLAPATAVFFPLPGYEARELGGGRLKMAAASLGVGGWERYLISPLLSCEAAPQPSWARGPGALPEAQNGGAAAAPCSQASPPLAGAPG